MQDQDHPQGLASERLYRTVLGRLQEGVVLLAPDHTVVDANPAALELSHTLMGEGHPVGQLLESLPLQLFDIEGNRVPWEASAPLRALKGEETTEDLLRAVYGDRHLWVQLNAGPVIEDGRITGAIVTLTDVTERINREQRVQHEADHDHLTGLANRRMLDRALDATVNRAVHNGRGVAVLMLDLDGFKAVNDELGHPAGDVVLRSIADRLRGVLRERDLVARFGGDEFVIVLADLQRTEEVAAAFADRVARAVAEPIPVGRRDLSLRASIGTAVFPRDARRTGSLLECADRSMYADKLLAGRGQGTIRRSRA